MENPKSNDNANSRLSRRTKNPRHCSHGPDQHCNFLYEIKAVGKKLLAKQSRSSCAVLDDAFLTEGAVAIGKLTTLQKVNSSSMTPNDRSNKHDTNGQEMREDEKRRPGILPIDRCNDDFSWLDIGLQLGDEEVYDGNNTMSPRSRDYDKANGVMRNGLAAS